MGRGRSEQTRRAQARSIGGNGVPDLSRARMSDEQAWRAQATLEMALGMRCHGCGRRVTVGLRFVSIDVTSQQPAAHRTACTRDDCDFAERARDGATAGQMVEYAWFDVLGDGSPAFGLGEFPDGQRPPAG